MTPWLWLAAKIGFAFAYLVGAVPVLIMMERRISAFIQGRKGPNRVGPMGSLQPLADIIKFLTKESIVPLRADRWLFVLSPLLVFVPPMLGFAVVPFGNQFGDERLQIANLDVGILFSMSVLSLGVYGITLGGWASNNKYSLLGSLRASAQLISYELSLGLTILLAVMIAGTLDPVKIVEWQVEHGWNLFGGGSLWRLPLGLIGGLLMFVCALAENNRLPFDLAECEAELVGGYHTEYSSMAFAMFFMGEYIAMVVMSGLITTLYLGGWHFPGITDPTDHTWMGALLSIGVFTAKVYVLLFTYVWVRWTLPRFKYNQLMDLGWKVFLPVALVNLAAMAIVGVILEG